MRILSGIQSSGNLHLGNYYGAIREFIRLQDEGEALYFIANLHALNTVRDAALARQFTFKTACAFLALGLDPKKATLFRQSDVPEVIELMWLLATIIPISNLERAHSYRDKIENKGVKYPEFALLAYPVLMAADILLYDSDVVPVGRDQKQHLEFTRDWATKFNVCYVPGYDPQDCSKRPGIFKLPREHTLEAVAMVPGRDGRKMSKSYGNTIDLFGNEKEIAQQIKSVKTDTRLPDAPKSLESQPLYELLRVVLPAKEFDHLAVEWQSGGDSRKGYGYFKDRLLAGFHSTFDEPRRRFEELKANPEEIEQILKVGAEKARTYAAPVMRRVRSAVGL